MNLSHKSKPILIVEDDIYIMNTMTEIFMLYDREILVAKDGKSGIEILKKLRPHEFPCCIILDLMMPVMTGQEFIYQIQALGNVELDSIPIIISSASTDVDLMDEPRVVQKLKKPISIEDLELIAQTYT